MNSQINKYIFLNLLKIKYIFHSSNLNKFNLKIIVIKDAKIFHILNSFTFIFSKQNAYFIFYQCISDKYKSSRQVNIMPKKYDEYSKNFNHVLKK